MSRSPIIHYVILCYIFYERINDDDDDDDDDVNLTETSAY